MCPQPFASTLDPSNTASLEWNDAGSAGSYRLARSEGDMADHAYRSAVHDGPARPVEVGATGRGHRHGLAPGAAVVVEAMVRVDRRDRIRDPSCLLTSELVRCHPES